ncbi:MAG: hypothetical protein JOZ99_02570 [Actinobacteria bacterium]|nr:hypothetical protein [Actinomycetota bacterium]
MEPRHARTRPQHVTVARVVAVVAVLALLVAGIVVFTRSDNRRPSPSCNAKSSLDHVTLDLAQSANATTIAAVGKRLGMPDHAVTVALAAALQESRLRNLPGGDRDSLGLFQQRPSQGWGSSAQLMQPPYAAAAFYRALAKVPDWAGMSVTEAAQAVQRSSAPNAYARWESDARTLAIAMTGQVAGGFTCRFDVPSTTAGASVLTGALTAELGSPATGQAVPAARGWTVASWLVGHASQYGITSVAFAGLSWSPASGAWSPAAGASQQVTYRLASVAA